MPASKAERSSRSNPKRFIKKNYAGSENHSSHWLRKRKPLWYQLPQNSFTSKTPLPADKKGLVREIQQSIRRRKEVTIRLEYQPQTSKSTRHRHCRAKLRVYQGWPHISATANLQKLPSLIIASPTALNQPCSPLHSHSMKAYYRKAFVWGGSRLPNPKHE